MMDPVWCCSAKHYRHVLANASLCILAPTYFSCGRVAACRACTHQHLFTLLYLLRCVHLSLAICTARRQGLQCNAEFTLPVYLCNCQPRERN
jgi:hypothetical protein